MMKKIMIFFVLLGFAGLSIVMRTGGHVPADYKNSELLQGKLTFSDWRFYSYREWYKLAFEKNEQRDFQSAEVAAKRALAMNPASAAATIALFRMYNYTGQVDKAIFFYDKHEILFPARHKKIFKAKK